MSAGGLFAHRTTSGGRAFKLHREKEQRALLGHFAEYLADGLDVPRAAAKLGRSAAWGSKALRRLQDELGEQAV